MEETAFVQVAYVVRDMRASALAWVKLFGAGPFFLTDPMDLDYVHRGHPAKVRVSGAFGQLRDVQIELIQQHSDAPSFYRDLVAPGEDRLHHMARVVVDLDAEVRKLEAAGCVTAARIEYGEVRVAHVDAVEQLGHMIELMQDAAGVRRLLSITRTAAAGWTGVDPLRDMSWAIAGG